MTVRLGPIYNALDNGDYKNTLRLIRNAESRHGPDAILFALKALALVRSERIEEGREAARDFVNCRPLQPAVLETALLVFKELGQYDWNREVYEAAVERCPSEESLLTGLYFAYLREWSFLKQQHTAMRLFKTFGVEKYLRWASICIELQNGALETPSLMTNGDEISPLEPGLGCRLLQLASMVLEKDSEPAIMSQKCLYQYLRILNRLGRHEAIVKVLQERRDSDPELQLQLARSLNILGMYNETSAILKDLMETRNPDDWRYLKLFVEAQVAFSSQFESDSATAVLRSLRSTGKRGPWLAELYATCLVNLEPDSHIIEYFQEFGHKRSFFPDIEPYLYRVGNVENLLISMQVSSDVFSEDNIRRRVSYEMCWRALRCHQSCCDDDLKAKAQSLYEDYIASVNPSKKKTEFGIGDDLCILCAYTLIDLYNRDEDRSYLLQAVAVLTAGLRSSPHNFQFLLLLIRLYAQLGAFIGAFEHYAALDTKSIQLETLTHIVQNDALRFGLISHAVALASAVVAHYDQYERDAPDLIVLCHVKDNLDQAVEFAQFRERLRRSFRLAESRQILQLFIKYLDKDISCAALRVEIPADVNPEELISNDDFLLLLHPEKERGPVLSQSSSFLLESSWHPVTEHSRAATLQFLRTALCLTNAMACADASMIRQTLLALGQELSRIGVVDLNAPVSSNDCFMKQHWRYCVLIFECAANISQCWSVTASVIEGHNNGDINLNYVWADVQRQAKLIELVSQQLSHTLLELLDNAHDNGAASLAAFVNFAARWSVLLLDLVATLLPVKRTLFERVCKKSNNRNIELEEDIWRLLSESLTALGSLKVTILIQIEALRDRLTALRTCLSPKGIFDVVAIKQIQDEVEITNSVVELLTKSRKAVCDHALDGIQRCLKALFGIKFHKM